MERAPTPVSPSGEGPIDIERLFREHNAALLRFISAKVGSEQEAREIAQEAYVHLLQLDHPAAISFLRAFLFKTAANLAIDRLRQRSRRSQTTTVADLDFAVFELNGWSGSFNPNQYAGFFNRPREIVLQATARF